MAEFVSESRNYCLHVESKLLRLVEEQGAFTLREAVDTVGPQLGTWPAETNQDFSYGMLGNLDSLTKRVRQWNRTGYTYLAMQISVDKTQWEVVMNQPRDSNILAQR